MFGEMWFAGQAKADKAAKEVFVSDLHGSSFSEIFGITLVMFCGALLRKLMHRASKLEGNYVWSNLIVDFVTLLIPGILSVTYASDYAWHMCFSVMALAGVHTLIWELASSSGNSWRKRTRDVQGTVRNVLSEYRSVLCLYTYICILAVDFPLFPRRLAKAETYGVGLMDIGTGSFIVADALLSRIDSHCRCDPQAERGRVAKSRAAAAKLAAIGALRVVATKAMSYQEHVGEYGVHWNFFWTLAFVKCISPCIPTRVCLPAGAILTAMHQFSLTHWGLADLVNAPDRVMTNLFSQNKEGILSLAGFLALHLLSRSFAATSGLMIYTSSCGKCKSEAVTRSTRGRRVFRHVGLTVIAAACSWALALGLDAKVERISRRSSNAAYIFWILASNLSWLSFCYMTNFGLGLNGKVWLCVIINKFAFLTFMFANLAVGAVNFSTNTLKASDTTALCIIVAYMLVICALAHFLYYHLLKNKLIN